MNTADHMTHPDANQQQVQPMHSIELEATIIATAMKYPESFRWFSEIKVGHFASSDSREVWKVLRELALKGDKWNVVSLNIATESRFKDFLLACNSYATSLSPKQDADRLIDYAYRRRIVKAAEAQIAAAAEGKSAAEIAIIGKKANESVFAQADFITGREACELLLTDMSSNIKPRSTGIAALDEAMEGGMHPGEMYVLGGRKKTGKTMFGGTLSYNLSQQGAKHLYIAAEMGAKRIHQRVMARQLQTTQKAFKYGHERYAETATEVAYQMSRMPDSVLYANAPGITLERLKQVISTAVLKHGIEGTIIDYWQIIAGRGNRGEREHLDYVAQEIANIHEQFGIWNWTLSQINQDGNTRGGEGARNACTMMFEMHREDKTEPWIWFEMKETRNTEWVDIGSAQKPIIMLDGHGPYIRQTTPDDPEPNTAHYSATEDREERSERKDWKPRKAASKKRKKKVTDADLPPDPDEPLAPEE